MSKGCKDCWHQYHCPMQQEGYNFDPDTCPHISDFTDHNGLTCSDCPHERKCRHKKDKIVTCVCDCLHKKNFDSRKDQVILYGEPVRFYWCSEHYKNNTELVREWEGYLEGLFGGIYDKNEKLAVVTVTTKGRFRGTVLHPYIDELEIIGHEPVEQQPKITKPSTREYDRQALYDMLEDIMDNFDFRKVARVMKFLNWKWASLNGEEHVPTETEIRTEARRLIISLIDKVGTDKEIRSVETGGFGVFFNEYDGKPDITLRFILEDWNEGYDTWDEQYKKGVERRKGNGVQMLEK